MTAISPLLQDADRKLSQALARTPGARLHATEAAAAIAADTPAGVAADPRPALMMGDEPEEDALPQPNAPSAEPADWWFRSRTADLLHLLQFSSVSTATGGDDLQAQRVMAELKAALSAAPQQTAPQAVPVGALQWTPGPNEFKDWCSQWFGPDSDDDYLARAVHDLPPMAQRFTRTPPAAPVPTVQPLTEAQRKEILQRIAGRNDWGVPYLRVYEDGFAHVVAAIEAALGITATPAPTPEAP